MPIQTVESDHGEWLTIRGTGELTTQEFLETHQAVATSEQKHRIRWVFADCSAVEMLDMTINTIQWLGDFCRRISTQTHHELQIAIFVPSEVLFGLIRMWLAFQKGARWNCRVFRARSEAEQWLEERITRANHEGFQEVDRTKPVD
jgi:hypothetical protein